VKNWLLALGAILAALLGWLLTTDSPYIWSGRNVLQYRLLRLWWALTGPPRRVGSGRLCGTVRDIAGKPIEGAWIVISEWNGRSYSACSQADGTYEIAGVPAASYSPVAAALGFESAVATRSGSGLRLRPNATTRADIVLTPLRPHLVTPGRSLRLSEAEPVSCQAPLESQAMRRRVTFDRGGKPNQITLLYTPETDDPHPLPLLLAIYPGPADDWESASVPLAQAGYAVLAAGPAYSLDLEPQVDELLQMLEFARQGRFPPAAGQRIAVLGGSYSGLHVLRLLQRDPKVSCVVLLGPPTDLFALRWQLEQGTFLPPYGLDRALIALGLPSRQPLRYCHYSAVYHIRPDLPPLLLMHSRGDEVVPYSQSERLAAALAAARVPHRLQLFDGASHYLLSEAGESTQVYEWTLAFLAAHLSP
jgi:dipeptidyl aminopeptidase/acylaminoacyl peptidase